MVVFELVSLVFMILSDNVSTCQNISFAGRAFCDKVDRLKLAEIVKQAIEEKTNLQESQ